MITSYPSLLTVFRARLGEEIYEQMFDGIVAQTRAAGLVKDRLTPHPAPGGYGQERALPPAGAPGAWSAHSVARLPQATGRQVVIHNDTAEYAAARDDATSKRYRQIRPEHPASARTLADVVHRHARRRARARGRARTGSAGEPRLS